MIPANHPLYFLAGARKPRQAGESTFSAIIRKLTIYPGDRVAIVGKSGSGKSTVLDMLALIIAPTEADQFQLWEHRDDAPHDVKKLWNDHNHDGLAALRRCNIGYVAQTGGLIGSLTVTQNLWLPQILANHYESQWVRHLVETLGLLPHLHKHPRDLSIGERQRVAIARALIIRPALVIADEPTASIDVTNAWSVMELFSRLIKDLGTAVVLATHDLALARNFGFRPLHYQVREEAGVVQVEFWDGEETKTP
ncbi:putative ABC transport system ATP-binding protein [Gammaproteobacteria bacterium]